MNEIKKISPRLRDFYRPWYPSPTIQRNDNLLFIAGIVGRCPDGDPEPDFERQVELAYDDLKARLAMENCTFENIIDITVLITDGKYQCGPVLRVHRKIFGAGLFPNWTLIEATWLASFDVEIKAIARIPE